MTVKPLTEQQSGYLSLKGGCTGSSESILVKMLHMYIVANHVSQLMLCHFAVIIAENVQNMILVQNYTFHILFISSDFKYLMNVVLKL